MTPRALLTGLAGLLWTSALRLYFRVAGARPMR
jgi:hypothetical protein